MFEKWLPLQWQHLLEKILQWMFSFWRSPTIEHLIEPCLLPGMLLGIPGNEVSGAHSPTSLDLPGHAIDLLKLLVEASNAQ